MNAIELNNVCIDYPFKKLDGYNFKSTIRNLFSEKQEEQTYRALDNVNFIVKEGQSLGLIGLNGAGKSTLLRVMSDILIPHFN